MTESSLKGNNEGIFQAAGNENVVNTWKTTVYYVFQEITTLKTYICNLGLTNRSKNLEGEYWLNRMIKTIQDLKMEAENSDLSNVSY